MKPTLTIGIPAYNEEGNILNLLQSIFRQSRKMFMLTHVIVACDGCTDDTVSVVKKFAQTHSCIKLIVTEQRSGKADALNRIYDNAQTSDYLYTTDADLVFEGKHDLEKLVTQLENNPQCVIAGPRHIPLWPETQWGRFAYVSYRSFEDAFLHWNHGNNFHTVMAAILLRGSFARSFRFPKGTISDQCYVYIKATQNNPSGFIFVSDAHVYFRPVDTFRDWRLLGIRSTAGDKDDVLKHFGNTILPAITIPKQLVILSLCKWMLKSPWYTFGSLLMNIGIRLFPYKKTSINKGMWEPTQSSKKGLHLSI